MLETLQLLAEKFGVPVALLGWFMWRDWQREKVVNARDRDQVNRIRHLEDRLIELQMQHAHELKAVAARMVDALQQVAKATDRFTRQFLRRPCQQDTPSEMFYPHDEQHEGHGNAG
jgi:hypothetical protein